MELKWEETATRFLKANRKHIKDMIDYKKPVNKNIEEHEFITTSLNPALQGTLLDTLFSWIANKEIIVDKWGLLNYYAKQVYNKKDSELYLERYDPFIMKIKLNDELYKEWSNNNTLYKMAHLSALLTYGYRTGFLEDAIKRFEDLEENEESYSKSDLEAFKKLRTRIESKVKNVLENEFIDNPVFGGRIPNGKLLNADGDYFYNNTLGDMKSSKDIKLKPDYIYQLMIYYWLNSLKSDKLIIENLEIYNPLWNIEYSIGLKDIEYDFSKLER